MSQYFFRISHGNLAGVSDSTFDLDNRDVAWTKMTTVCGEMVASLCHNLKPKSDWKMELLDETRKPVFRIQLVAEALK